MRIGDRREAPGPQIQMSVEQIQKDVPEQIDSAMKTTGNGDGIPCPAIGKAQIFAVAFCTELLESGVPDATAQGLPHESVNVQVGGLFLTT